MKKPSRMTVAIYARVSTEEQGLDDQLDKLREHCRRWEWEAVEYLDKISGKEGASRPGLEQLLRDASRKEFAAVLVHKMDRFGRSTLDTLTNIRSLDQYGVRFIALQEHIDTDKASPTGKFILTIFAAVAELERSFILERTGAGLKRYRRNYAAGIVGVTCHSKSGKDLPIGRPKVVFDRQRARDMHAKGRSVASIARLLGVGVGTVHRTLHQAA
jgi:DNA invertase Pin-like site-specific DNA recombinase